MKNTKNMRIVALILLIVSAFLFATGCTININIDNPSNDTENEAISDHDSDTSTNISLYQSRATIYISNKGSAESLRISSSDLSVSKSLTETYAVILNTKKIKSKIQEEYPNVECELTLEPTNETALFDIIATSENSEKLEDICNLAASLFCEEVPLIIDGASSKIVDCAKSAQLVGTN